MAVILDADDPNVQQAQPYVMPELYEEKEVKLNEANTIVLHAGEGEMLKITDKGFWVRGVQVPQDEREAKLVYDAFREWMTWASLTRKY